jgi:hypothetical protein
VVYALKQPFRDGTTHVCCTWMYESAQFSSISTGAMALEPAHGHRPRNLCTRTRPHLQPRYLQSSSRRGFRSRPKTMGTNSLAGAVRPEPVGLSAWNDLSAWRSSVSIGSSESVAQTTNLQQPNTPRNHTFAPLILLSASLAIRRAPWTQFSDP